MERAARGRLTTADDGRAVAPVKKFDRPVSLWHDGQARMQARDSGG